MHPDPVQWVEHIEEQNPTLSAKTISALNGHGRMRIEYDEKNYRTHEYSHMLFEGMSSMNNHLFLKG